VSEPTQDLTGATVDTTGSDLIPPGADQHQESTAEGALYLSDEIGRLRSYLLANFPDQVDLANRQVPESTVSTTIRILALLSTRANPNFARCEVDYCNRPAGHDAACGWVVGG
jgi:hypothetical protein